MQSPVSSNILRKCFLFILYNTIYSYPSVSSGTMHLHRFELCICLCKKKRAIHTHKIVPFNKPLSCDRYTSLEDNLLEKFSNSVDMLEIDEWSLVWRIVELTETVRQKIGLPRTTQFHGFRFYLGIAKENARKVSILQATANARISFDTREYSRTYTQTVYFVHVRSFTNTIGNCVFDLSHRGKFHLSLRLMMVEWLTVLRNDTCSYLLHLVTRSLRSSVG